MLCILMDLHQSFRETYCLHLQDLKICQATSQQEADLLAWFTFDPEDRDSMIPQNTGEHLPDCTAFYPRRQYSL
jgi:hypothetical protein